MDFVYTKYIRNRLMVKFPHTPHFALVEEYTVLENVRIPLYFSHSKKSDKPKALALAALKRVGISELANKPVNFHFFKTCDFSKS